MRSSGNQRPKGKLIRSREHGSEPATLSGSSAWNASSPP
jgi:hypothetical protein